MYIQTHINAFKPLLKWIKNSRIFFLLWLFAAFPAHAVDISLKNLQEKYRRPPQIHHLQNSTPFPPDNPYTADKALLGEKLFFDPRLSRSKVMSCGTCHNPAFDWGDRQPQAVGDFHKELSRKSPSLWDIAWGKNLFWDGRATSLEQQALQPIQSPAEMGNSIQDMLFDLDNIPAYHTLFKKAFPDSQKIMTETQILQALATFERTLISPKNRFDAWIEGDKKALTPQEISGFKLFNGKAKCALCHTGWRFTDDKFHDIGLRTQDKGKYAITKKYENMFQFRTMGLRQISKRMPYMHHGQLPTLEAVIDHYNAGFIKRDSLSPLITQLHLTRPEKQALLAFLKTLSAHHTYRLPELP